jgi:Zn-dependent protease
LAIKVGSIAGIPIALDYSWFVIFLLIAWTVGFNMMPATYPGLGEAAYLFIGVLSSLLLFGSVLVHELAHSIVAKRNNLRINRITLFLFGGVSEIEEEPQEPMLELRMAAAGPLTSVALAGLSGLLWDASVLLSASPLIQAPLQYCALVNAIVAGFNLIPAFPMDGGRVLRSLLWKRTGDLLRSTRMASASGRVFAYGLVFVGILLVVSVDIVTGFWLIIIGWFISSGAQSALNQTRVQEDLRGLRAAEVMTRSVDSVQPEMTLEEFYQESFRLKHNGFPVMSGDQLVGCMTTDDLRKVKKESWRSTKVADAMTPKEKLVLVGTEDQATQAMRLMNKNRIGRVFVTNPEGRLAGIITRSDVLRAVQIREALPGTGARGIGLGKISFTVELDMNFVLEQPVEPGLDWRAEFAGGVQLVSEAVSRTAQGQEMKQFVFHASMVGEHPIRLVAVKQGPGASTEPRRVARTIAYTVTVSKA